MTVPPPPRDRRVPGLVVLAVLVLLVGGAGFAIWLFAKGAPG